MISKCNSVRDLGINVSCDLSWSLHISHIARVASLRCYQILLSFSSKNVWVLLKAYLSYVRPILEHNSVVWSPYLKKDICAIESVQRSFTRNICIRCNIPFKSYSDRLYKLNIKSLEYRRVEFDLILMYKICYGLVDIAFSDMFSFCTSPYNLRRHNVIVQSLMKPNSNFCQNFFSNRIPHVWNRLPKSLVNSSSITAFKTRLRKFNLLTIIALNC